MQGFRGLFAGGGYGDFDDAFNRGPNRLISSSSRGAWQRTCPP